MLEIEQKFARADFALLERRLAEWGAAPGEIHEEADHYFNAPDRDFARTDEAFRLRRVGSANFLTYKGPKQRADVKVRTELEVPIQPGDEAAADMTRLLTHLGYRFVAVVTKRRRTAPLQRDGFSFTICLDEVEGLGRFAEVEVLASEERRVDAERALAGLAAELGLKEVERRSYLGLVLAARRPGGGAVNPVVVSTEQPLRQAVAAARRAGKTIGLVPTMGALHAGHVSLIDAARAAGGFVAVSIFVNPTQFGANEDLTRYPRPLARDLEMCANAGVDLVFTPDAAIMYPPGFRTFIEVNDFSEVLEGASRPGHFRGVATVVLKLFNLVQPDRAYFGQKDAQQVRVIRQMVRDLDVPVEVIVRPTVREPDGLALSSRNQYLDANQRREAVALNRALEEAEAAIRAGERNAVVIERTMAERIKATPGAVLDYAVAVDADTLRPMTPLRGAVLLALAVKFGPTRLIDNRLVEC